MAQSPAPTQLAVPQGSSPCSTPFSLQVQNPTWEKKTVERKGPALSHRASSTLPVFTVANSVHPQHRDHSYFVLGVQESGLLSCTSPFLTALQGLAGS